MIIFRKFLWRVSITIFADYDSHIHCQLVIILSVGLNFKSYSLKVISTLFGS